MQKRLKWQDSKECFISVCASFEFNILEMACGGGPGIPGCAKGMCFDSSFPDVLKFRIPDLYMDPPLPMQ
jgi:hypothetical protein